jgi:hypothetical protein
MKKQSFSIVLFLSLLVSCLPHLKAQNKLSFDLAGISNRHSNNNGLNLSVFYYFNEQISAGIEFNRFFPVNKNIEGDLITQSAWDFDYNLHYIIPVGKDWKVYPLTGFSHTAEKETNTKTGESIFNRFWSYNTGAGLLFEWGKWSPHIEYSFAWGKINQQFFIAGISYELSFKKQNPSKD